MNLVVQPLAPSERGEWEPLARAYKDFYRTVLPDAAYEATWRRLMAGDAIHGLGARLDGLLVGITHYLYHAGIWAPRACYLEDLYVAPAARGHGVARKLIGAVAQRARADGAVRLYWLTHETNATARLLYDRVASCSGFVEYEYPMDG